jgi:hypothetical protein
MKFFENIFKDRQEKPIEPTEPNKDKEITKKIEQKEGMKKEQYENTLLSEKEALLYQDYATKIEGSEFSDRAGENTYEEADRLIERLKNKKFDFLNIDWDKFDLKNATQFSNLQDRLDAAVRMIATTEKGKNLSEVINKYGKVIIPFFLAARLILGLSGEAGAEEMKVQEDLKNAHNFNFKAYMPYKDPNGISWKVILEPFALSGSMESKQEKQIKFDIPYEYARLFDTGKPISPEDYDKLNQYIKEKLEQELKSWMLAFPFDKNSYNRKFQEEFDPQNIEITNVSLIGYTSSEARDKVSVQPGVIDQENIKLGLIRAGNANEKMAKVFEDLGIKYDKDAVNIQSIETQFSDQEFEALSIIAGRMDTTIFQLIKDYNDNLIEDAGVRDKLDTIVGEKRKVAVMVEMKDGAEKIVIIPVPLLLALPLLAFPFLKRRKDKELLRGANLKAPYQNMPEGRLPKNALPPEEDEQMKPASKEIEKRSRLEIPKQEQILEFYRLDTLRDVIHNPDIYLEIAAKYKDYNIDNTEEAINSLACEILDKWMEVDREAREKVGLPAENYYDRPHQVLYAFFHAAVVKGFIAEMKEGRNIVDDDPVNSYYHIQKVVEKEMEMFRQKV